VNYFTVFQNVKLSMQRWWLFKRLKVCVCLFSGFSLMKQFHCQLTLSVMVMPGVACQCRCSHETVSVFGPFSNNASEEYVVIVWITSLFTVYRVNYVSVYCLKLHFNMTAVEMMCKLLGLWGQSINQSINRKFNKRLTNHSLTIE